MWFDSHTHFLDASLDALRPELIEQLIKADIRHLIDIPLSPLDWSPHLALAEQFKPDLFISCALGFHPLYLPKTPLKDAIDALWKQIQSSPSSIVAMGEIGLDFYAGREGAAHQLAWLDAQLDLASRVNLPVILHVRKAHEEVFSALHDYPHLRGVIHAFAGSPELAQRYVELGFKLGIGGQLTYANAHKLRRCVAQLPIEHFLIETDSPWMRPSGYNAELNTPLSLLQVAQTLADLKQMRLDVLQSQLWVNTQEMFFK